MFALPYAILVGGWSAVLLIVLIGLCSLYTQILLCRLQYDEKGKLIHKDVNEVSKAAFGNKFAIFSCVIQMLELFGATCMYVVLGGTTLNLLIPLLSKQFWIVVFSIVGITLCYRITDVRSNR
eukprot:UN01391